MQTTCLPLAALAGPAAQSPAPPAVEAVPPFNVPLTLLAEAGGLVDMFHGFHDGEAWYAYDLPAAGQWRVTAWRTGYGACPPGLPDGIRLLQPALLHPACGLLP